MDRAHRDRLDHPLCDEAILEEFHGPSNAFLRRMAAGQSNQVRFLLLVEGRSGPGTGRVPESSIDPFRAVFLPYPLHRANRPLHFLGNLGVLLPGVALEEDLTSFDNAGVL